MAEMLEWMNKECEYFALHPLYFNRIRSHISATSQSVIHLCHQWTATHSTSNKQMLKQFKLYTLLFLAM